MCGTGPEISDDGDGVHVGAGLDEPVEVRQPVVQVRKDQDPDVRDLAVCRQFSGASVKGSLA